MHMDPRIVIASSNLNAVVLASIINKNEFPFLKSLVDYPLEALTQKSTVVVARYKNRNARVHAAAKTRL
jgi:hypothetical protein